MRKQKQANNRSSGAQEWSVCGVGWHNGQVCVDVSGAIDGAGGSVEEQWDCADVHSWPDDHPGRVSSLGFNNVEQTITVMSCSGLFSSCWPGTDLPAPPLPPPPPSCSLSAATRHHPAAAVQMRPCSYQGDHQSEASHLLRCVCTPPSCCSSSTPPLLCYFYISTLPSTHLLLPNFLDSSFLSSTSPASPLSAHLPCSVPPRPPSSPAPLLPLPAPLLLLFPFLLLLASFCSSSFAPIPSDGAENSDRVLEFSWGS